MTYIKLADPLSHAETVEMAQKNEGLISAVIGIEFDTLVSLNGIDEFNDLVNVLVLGEDCACNLGYQSGIEFKVVGLDTQEILVLVQADINPEYYE